MQQGTSEIYYRCICNCPIFGGGNKSDESIFYEKLIKSIPEIRGLEVPFFGEEIHQFDSDFLIDIIQPSWENMITKLSEACQQYNVQELCDLFDHARSSYYYQSRNKPMDSDTKAIIKSMKQISIETGYTYGHRRLKLQLNADGYRVGTHRIKTLMKMANIKVIKPKKRHYYPNTGKLHKRADNLLDCEFNQANSNTHWVGDITYIKTYQGWSYLACVLDLASRQVVGWALSKQPNTQLAQDAMDNAINRYQPNTDNLMFHSDQGTQYSSKAFIDYCSKNSITQSMSRKGNCWDNAVMERFFRSP